jgi:hypothetical protein
MFPVLAEKYELTKLGEIFYDVDEEDQRNNTFYVAGEQVSESIYHEFQEEQDKKENVIWYEFTDENIDALLQE